MRKFTLIACASALFIASCSMLPSMHGGGGQGASAIAASMADARRTDAERERDARSRPAEILAIAGVKPGAKVADLVIGGGYYSRLFAGAVGPTGSVYAWQPAEFVKFDAKYGEALTTLPTAYPNITTSGAAFADVALPKGLDLAFTNQNYHDLHLKPFAADTASHLNSVVFKALKPGGVYLVIDHAALPGADVNTTANGLHRIDKEAVKREVMAAGFKFESESALLANPADTHTANVFDGSIRGHTDQFILKFRKPRF